MKKLLLSVTLVTVFCLSSVAQISFGPKVGLNLVKYSYNYKEASCEPDVKMRMAPLVGAVVNFQFTDALALQSGLFFSGKGSSYDLDKNADEGYKYDGYSRTSTGYMQLPVNVAYGIAIGESQIQIFAGPYVAYGITGINKWDYTVTHDGESETYKDDCKVKFKNEVDESDYEDDENIDYQTALDYGVGFGIGFKTGPVLINAGYELGLANLRPKWGGEGDYDNNDWKYTNGVINVSASYLFGGK